MRLLTSPTDIRLATAPIIVTSEATARSTHRGITHPDPRLARSAEEAVSEASAAALSEALEAFGSRSGGFGGSGGFGRGASVAQKGFDGGRHR